MTPKERAAMQQALEALEAAGAVPSWFTDYRHKAITALREALAEQEPVAYTNSDQLGYLKDPLYENAPMAMWSKPFDERINVSLYAAPVRTKDLTPHEITELIREGAADGGWQGFAQRVIAADREKNK